MHKSIELAISRFESNDITGIVVSLKKKKKQKEILCKAKL